MPLNTSFNTELPKVKVRLVTRLSKRGLEYDVLEIYALTSDNTEVSLTQAFVDDNIRYKLSTTGNLD